MIVSYEDFKKLDLKVATVIKAERVENSDKLVRLEIDLGESFDGAQDKKRQIIAGIAKQYPPEKLEGRQIIVIANLEPRKLMSLESQGMLLAADASEGPILLQPEKPAPNGAVIK